MNDDRCVDSAEEVGYTKELTVSFGKKKAVYTLCSLVDIGNVGPCRLGWTLSKCACPKLTTTDDSFHTK